MALSLIDVSFDLRSDARGKDPDTASPTLRAYHRLLWGKPLPTGPVFSLDTVTLGDYLHHRSEVGEFFLSSDSVVPTYSYWQSTADLIGQVPEAAVAEFDRMGYTIGAMMVFPSNQVDRKPTLNAARGMNNRSLGDRMDLTLECIRRHYLGDNHTPLGATIARYSDFFALFGDFAGYVDFFLLQDLVTPGGDVRFFLPFNDFDTHAVPADLTAYDRFRQASMAFVEARNARIDRWARANFPAS